MHSFAANPLVVFRPHLKHKRSGEEYLALADSDLQDPPPRPQPLDPTYQAERHDSPTDESSVTQAAPDPPRTRTASMKPSWDSGTWS